ncbi:unnamed protein product [Sphagnum jensenii]
MSIMVVAVVRELGIMHLVTGSETYKTASRVVTQVLGRVDEKMNSETLGRDVAVALEDTPLNGGLDVDFEKLSLDADDYADWIKWVSDAEKGKQAIFETVNRAEVPVLL